MATAIINGSPRGMPGATGWMLERFVKGMKSAGDTPVVVNLSSKKIHHCTGELHCWFKTPGKCIHKDDVDDIVKEIGRCENWVIATPVYVDGMTGLIKNFIDRLVPYANPHFKIRGGHTRHKSNNDIKNVALISACGFPELDNFDSLIAHIKAICENMDAKYAGALLRPAAPMLPEMPMINPLFFKIRAVSKAVEKAGREFVENKEISEKTASEVAADIISQEVYIKETNKWFDKELGKIK